MGIAIEGTEGKVPEDHDELASANSLKKGKIVGIVTRVGEALPTTKAAERIEMGEHITWLLIKKR